MFTHANKRKGLKGCGRTGGTRMVRTYLAPQSMSVWADDDSLRGLTQKMHACEYTPGLLQRLQIRAEAAVRYAGLQRAQVAPVKKCRI